MAKKTHLAVGMMLVVFGVLLSGCELGKSSPQNQDVLTSERPGVTIKGVLSSVADKFFIKDSTRMVEVTSRKLDLKGRVGDEVEVYGEFSGTTLYVDEIR